MSDAGGAAIELRSVTKRYRTHIAVEDLSLTVPRGAVFGLLGENGAGKSTTLRILMNIRVADSGTVRVLGGDPARDRSVLRRVGYLPEERGLYQKMNVLEVLIFFGELKGLAVAEARKRAKAWLERMRLSDVAERRVETLSKGNQQKVQFAATVMHEPELWVLDEPFSGLDPVNQQEMREAIAEARRAGRTVLLSTHVMEHAEELCDRVAIIARGKKRLDASMSELGGTRDKARFELELARPSASIDLLVADRALIANATGGGARFELELADGVDARKILAALAQSDCEVERFEHKTPSLREIFLETVRDAHA